MMRSRSWMNVVMVVGLGVVSIWAGGCASPRPIEAVRESGEHRMRAANYESAGQEYSEIVSRYPGDADAQHKLGICMLKTSQLSAARQALETAHDLKPNDKQIANDLAEVMFQQGDETRLFGFLRSQAATNQTTQAYLKLAQYAIELNDPDSAQTALETAIEIDDGKTTDPYLEAAKLAERLGQMEEAVRRLRQAYGINPVDFRVLERLKAMGEEPSKVSPLPPGR
ncbi:MAG: tetratricopeptide repeat protein [Phycisphaerales bacterium]|nr:tetratricopeptide repeat protein [Phycisphaerales bacterium]MCI0675524.1 tetratricopeptide repeat protein [Phycisphaerales bacterium]